MAETRKIKIDEDDVTCVFSRFVRARLTDVLIGRAEGVPVLFISLFGKGSARGEPFYSVRARVKWAISFHEALSAN